jgi:hypothetical protein
MVILSTDLLLLNTIPASGTHSRRPSASFLGLNLGGRALKVWRTQSAIASGWGGGIDLILKCAEDAGGRGAVDERGRLFCGDWRSRRLGRVQGDQGMEKARCAFSLERNRMVAVWEDFEKREILS